MDKKHFKGILFVLMILTMALFGVGTAAAQPSSGDVLLVQTSAPWGTNSNQAVLDGLGYDYNAVSMDAVSDLQLSNYKMVIIADDQPQYFYDGYAEYQSKFENYVKQGGTLVFGACYSCWDDGDLNTILPGGVEHTWFVDYDNVISDTNHPIVTGIFTDGQVLTNTDLIGNPPSAVILNESSLPKGAVVIFRTDYSGDPTLVEYGFGKGTVIASCLLWEYARGYNGGNYAFVAYDDLFAYAMSLDLYVSSGHDSLPGHTSFSSHAGFEH